MVQGYHVVFGTYGYWLPNDMRGSLSKFIAATELRHHCPPPRKNSDASFSVEQVNWQRIAKQKLRYPEVFLDGHQALAVADGFVNAIKKSQLKMWACSILPQHVHLVLARHRFKVEYIVGLLKGEATKSLRLANIHPLSSFADGRGKIPTPRNVKSYHGFLESEQEIDDAIAYVDENPVKEGKKRQAWAFVLPFGGLDKGQVSYD